MASIMNVGKLGILKKNPVAVLTAVRHLWNKDFKPGPYPRSEEECRAAAEKYGIVPSEYQPYPDDGDGHGDYPKLPDIAGETKDPYYPWDFPEHKRNLHETLHVEADMIGEDRCHIDVKTRFSMAQMIFAWLAVMGFSAGTYLALENMKMFRPVLPKQYPGDGKVHYTFELE